MGWDTIIFDLDGTLLNSLEDIRNSANYTMRQLDFPEKSLDEIKAAVGNGVGHLMECCIPDAQKEDDAVRELALRMFKEHYFLHSEEKTLPYNGAEDLLNSICRCGLKTAVVSNKPDDTAQKVVRRFFGDKITYISGEKAGVRRKPAPDLVKDAIKTLGSEALESVYIGDSEVDALTARNAGLPVVLVSWGYRDRKMLESCHPDYLVDNMEELASLLIPSGT